MNSSNYPIKIRSSLWTRIKCNVRWIIETLYFFACMPIIVLPTILTYFGYGDFPLGKMKIRNWSLVQ
jgi:hypothetical protein